jgi:hypothetical protein
MGRTFPDETLSLISGQTSLKYQVKRRETTKSPQKQQVVAHTHTHTHTHTPGSQKKKKEEAAAANLFLLVFFFGTVRPTNRLL